MNTPFRDSDAQAWFESEPQWQSRVGVGWKGTKMLGRGSTGVAGLWEYLPIDGSSSSTAATVPKLKHVVVKMSPIDEFANLGRKRINGPLTAMDEGNMGLKLSAIVARHLVRQYGGNRVGDSFGELDEVVKLFLEYCPRGDLDQFFPRSLEEVENTLPPLHEYHLWTLFHCMAVGVMAMDRRLISRRLREKARKRLIFLGYRDPEHPWLPIAKIGDFGETVEIPAVNRQDDAYGARFSDRGADEFRTPEDCINWRFSPWEKLGVPVLNPRKGTCTNIWQVGAIMNCLMLRTRLEFNARPAAFTYSVLPGRDNVLSGNANHSQRLETPEITASYSKELRELVQECMLRAPLQRPNSITLFQRTRTGLDATAQVIDPAQIMANLPSAIAQFPVMSMQQPEPPRLWLLGKDKFKLMIGQFKSLFK